ncbi:hypothetical protein [Rhodococcus sp. IEGM 1408]|uniref:hypothetical protein n=1 Tax=Rhodococcus sp. IEGM 1408 TaxID=3082220 RepID=UPI0029535DE6|nr:hypothetical protein [Rhodococcus sp. IEGM 1408]MDV8001719.1 hypothetical protein [Rhodococcus sp. IEGM 1408]
MSAEPLPGATSGGHAHGLDMWWDPDETHAMFWVAPAGATAVLDVVGNGDGTDAVELQWSTLSAAVPSTRAVVLLDGPGFGDPGEDFTFAHSVAEDVARFVTARSGVEAGPIEVLVFRPDTDSAPWPEPTDTPGGAEFRFPHRGGADVHLNLTLPAPTPPPPNVPTNSGEA